MNIRDFIYLDGQRLYSIYSQVFEGVAESVVRRVLAEAARTKEEKKPALSETVVEASDRTEQVVLHDWMYSRLETALEPIFCDPQDLSNQLEIAPLIRVRGRVEFEDYSRMNAFFDKFNELGKAIMYAHTGPLDNQLRELKESARKEKDRNEKARLNSLISAMQKKLETTAISGLQQDPQLLKNLKLFSEFFAPDGYQICVATGSEGSAAAYRSVLDRNWLRTSPALLRSLFVASGNAQVTLVGHVTHVAPSSRDDDNGDDDSGDSDDHEDEDDDKDDDRDRGSMRDAMRNMFTAASEMEKHFFESGERKEITVQPLAIYRSHAVVVPSQ